MESKRKYDPELGLFIFRLIQRSGYTQEAFAEHIGVSRESVNMYCSGKRRPSIRTFLKILEFSKVLAIDTPF